MGTDEGVGSFAAGTFADEAWVESFFVAIVFGGGVGGGHDRIAVNRGRAAAAEEEVVLGAPKLS